MTFLLGEKQEAAPTPAPIREIDPDVRKRQLAIKKQAQKNFGFPATVATSPLGVTGGASLSRKTLLGE